MNEEKFIISNIWKHSSVLKIITLYLKELCSNEIMQNKKVRKLGADVEIYSERKSKKRAA